MSPPVNVSLESHLISALEPLIPLTDARLSSQLSESLEKDRIAYSVLQSVSRWARSPVGLRELKSRSLDPNSYSMIALLAGTVTSPEGKFGTYVPPPDPEVVALERTRERKALTTVINGVLSVIGAGAAAWIGSEKTSWRREWRVLFALCVAAVVALSETVLYIIWQSRLSSSPAPPKVRRRYLRGKKEDGDDLSVDDTADTPDGLRQRKVHS